MAKVDIIQLRNPRLLNLTVSGIIAIMMGVSFFILQEPLAKAIGVVLCAAFGLMHAFGFRNALTPGKLSAYFATQAMIVLVLLWLSYPSDVFNLLFYILGLEVVLVFPGRAAAGWLVFFYAADSLVALFSRGSSGIINVLFYGAAFMLTAVFGYALRQAEIARRQNQQLLEELRASQRQLQEMAVVEERNRLAREMHDSLGHRLTVAVVQLEGAQRLIPTDPSRAAQMVGAMRDEMKAALSELRTTVSALRAPLPDELELPVSLADLVQAFQHNTGITTHFSVTPGFPVLPSPYRLSLYRAAQEALTNIQRHAEAHNAWLRLGADQERVTLLMEDDGKGLGDRADGVEGSGLLGMKERATQLSGRLVLSERPGGGTRLDFSVPRPQGVTPV